MVKTRRSLALMSACLAMGLLAAEARADETPAQTPPEPHTFPTELPEHAVTGEEPKEVDSFWKIPVKKSWPKIGGLVMLAAVHDLDATSSKIDLVPSTIPVDGGTPSEGSTGRTTFRYRQTRPFLDSLTAAGSGLIRAYASVNLIWSPYKALDLGGEVRHGQRRNIDGDGGSVTRLRFSGTYAF